MQNIIIIVAAGLVSFVIGWVVSRYHTETKMRREQTRRELELQKMATFASYIKNMQGGN